MKQDQSVVKDISIVRLYEKFNDLFNSNPYDTLFQSINISVIFVIYVHNFPFKKKILVSIFTHI